MTKRTSLDPEIEIQARDIPWEERLTDHENKIGEYLDNCLFRGCSVESTFNERRVVLHSIFRRVKIDDLTHPTGYRHLLLWDLLNPTFGSHYLSLIVSSLLDDDLALSTRRKYMNDLRYLCEYVLTKPHISGGNGLCIPDKYGPIAASLTKYDLPIHAADRPRRKRYALTPPLRDDFFEFLRVEHVPHCSLPHIGARNLTAIILQAEIGVRNSELVGIRSEGDSCDIDEINSRVRVFGKGSAYSGKRLRWVPLTPLAIEVLNIFQRVFKPMFPKSPQSAYLFLNEDGSG